jgi:hypothetical protein
MKNFIKDLEQTYLQRRKITKRLQKFPTDSSCAALFEELSGLNYQTRESISPGKFKQLIESGIRDSTSQKYLTELVWGQAAIEPSSTSKNGIIPLLNHQSEIIAGIIQKLKNQYSLAFDDSQFHTLLNLIQKELQMFNRFQKDFQALYQQRLSLNVIGFGEISTVLDFAGGRTFFDSQPERENWVYKKMPIFPNMAEVDKFVTIFEEYHRLFIEEIGVNIPDQRVQIHPLAADKIRLYVLQRKCNTRAVGNQLIQRFTMDESATLIEMILSELKKVWAYNQSNQRIKVAIDGQISNWVLDNFDPETDQFSGTEKLVYIDTSSPLYRIDEQEQLNPELFLKSTPFFLRPIIRALFLQEVLDRYYDLHLVVVDLIANFFKEGRAGFIPKMIATANHFFTSQMADFNLEQITEKEVTKYYKNDAFIWKFYLAARKIDRFITEKILGKKYEFRLPEKVKR